MTIRERNIRVCGIRNQDHTDSSYLVAHREHYRSIIEWSQPCTHGAFSIHQLDALGSDDREALNGWAILAFAGDWCG